VFEKHLYVEMLPCMFTDAVEVRTRKKVVWYEGTAGPTCI